VVEYGILTPEGDVDGPYDSFEAAEHEIEVAKDVFPDDGPFVVVKREIGEWYRA